MARDLSNHPQRPELVEQIVRALRSLDFLISDVQAVWASALKLTVPQWNILATIAEAHEQGGLPVKSVAEALRVYPSFIVNQSRPLEDRGFIKRNSSSSDKRVVYLSVTPKALKELSRLAESRDAATAAIKKEMGEAAVLHTLELLQQLERCFARCRLRLQVED
ncbi:MarR family winged helix-turn-helix transcriptional regulator [Bradyrhizobium vignae]|uniref:MarR family transcriptional regulator n=1 Tax=Bradyrhizobium vignae TaxID=1549949 RepID=A0ABS4A7J7_9BRAD|nr:MarR family transcriptional regulator [Bradyrhizobium vignae]MBP0116391.1 MarR family transcriptional regulator [Bradyrhizobium vignae]